VRLPTGARGKLLALNEQVTVRISGWDAVVPGPSVTDLKQGFVFR